jgi:hypothetical protein
VVSGPATVSGSTVTITGAGAVTIRASQAGNPNYNAAPDTDQTFDVARKAASVTPDAAGKTYGGLDPTLTGALSGFLAADGVSAAYTRTAGETVGPYTISATLSPSSVLGNYAITYNTAAFTITPRAVTVTADAQTKTYGDADPALTYHITSGGLAFADAFSGALGRAAGEDVGTYAIGQGDLALSANYALTYVGASLSITPRPITVTADDKTKVYGDADPALTCRVTAGSLVAGDSVTGTLTRVAGETVADGPYAIQQGTLTAGPNYSFTYVAAALAITPRAASVTPDAAGKVYGDANPAFTGTLSGFLTGDGVTATYSRTAGETVLGGPYTISATLGPAGVLSNYAITYNTAPFAISPRPATVTADAQSKVYGDADLALTATVSGTVNGDVLDFSLSTTATQFSGVGDYAITVTLGSNPNYAVAATDGTLTVTPRPATVTANDKTKTYGDANPALGATVGGTVNGDTLDYSLATSADQFSNAGDYAITVSLGDNPNYNVTAIDGTLTVAKANQTITWDDLDAVLTGTALGPAQLNATVAGVNGGSAPGALSYAPAAGTVLAAGAQTLKVIAAETVNYHAVSLEVPIQVYDPARISGVAFKDFNHDGEVDYGEEGVAGVVVSLSGTDVNGTPVSASATTDGSGYYGFGNLLPGDYTVALVSGGTLGVGRLGHHGVFVGTGTSGTGGEASATNNFALVPAAGAQLKKGQTAGIGYWQNKNGQALILKMNGSAGCQQLGNWLAENFPNMFGCLVGKTNAEVAACYRAVFATKGDKTEAHFFATALSLYVTSSILSGGTYAAAYGFMVTADGARVAVFNVGSCGAVAGLSSNTTEALMDILLALDDQASSPGPSLATGVGTLFVGNQPTRSMATELLAAINEWGNIG